jgi:hypothetical protein
MKADTVSSLTFSGGWGPDEDAFDGWINVGNAEFSSAYVFASPNIGDYTWNWQCDESGCLGQAYASIIGGVLGINMYDVNGLATSYIFNGPILGGSVYETLWLGWDGEESLQAQASYDFKGLWSNGWYGTGQGSAFWTDDGGGGAMSIATTAPEPATGGMLGGGFFAVMSALRRKRRFENPLG